MDGVWPKSQGIVTDANADGMVRAARAVEMADEPLVRWVARLTSRQH